MAFFLTVRIGGGMLIADLTLVASRVAELATQQNAEEEVLAEAPEEFYDPILSTLMYDPVILPSSKTTCDRSTIARFDFFFFLSFERCPIFNNIFSQILLFPGICWVIRLIHLIGHLSLWIKLFQMWSWRNVLKHGSVIEKVRDQAEVPASKMLGWKQTSTMKLLTTCLASLCSFASWKFKESRKISKIEQYQRS